jgi:hypothetical protein
LDIITDEDLRNIEVVDEQKLDNSGVVKVDDVYVKKLVEDLQNPVYHHKEIIVKVRNFLLTRIDDDIKEFGHISGQTLKVWQQYGDTLERIQKSMAPEDRSVNNFFKVSHSVIAAKIRKADITLVDDKDIKDGDFVDI